MGKWARLGTRSGQENFSGRANSIGRGWCAVLANLIFTSSILIADPADASWKTYTPFEGLAGSNIAGIAQDGDHHLWFATTSGVSHYNGVVWTTYTSRDTSSDGSHLFFDGAQCVLADERGGVWFGLYSRGLDRFDGSSWTHYTMESGLVGANVVTLSQGEPGQLWVGTTDGGACMFDGERWQPLTTAQGLPSNKVLVIFRDREHNIWFGTDAGLCRWDGTHLATFTAPDDLARNEVHAICEDGLGRMWVGFGEAGGGVSEFDGSRWKNFATADGLVADDVRAITADPSGEVWFGTWSGIGRLRKQYWEEFTTFDREDGLADNWVTCMHADDLGNLWIGTLVAGVSLFDGGAWRQITRGVPSGWVMTILQDGGGKLWVGTWGRGIGCYDGREWTYASSRDWLGSDFVWCSHEDSQGRLWFGTLKGGLSCYEAEGGWKTYWPTPGGLADSTVMSITEDATGTLYFGTGGKGISSYDGTHWQTLTLDGEAPDNTIHDGFCDSRGDLWFSTAIRGVARLTPGSDKLERFHPTSDGLIPSDADAIREDELGRVWFGTGDGIHLYDHGTWRRGPDGLGAVNVHQIVKDPEGHMVLGSSGGVTKFDGDRWILLAGPSDLINSGVFDMIVDRSGSLWTAAAGAYLLQFQWANVRPRSVIYPAPPRLSANRLQTAGFWVGYGDPRPKEFSYSLDNGSWAPWSGASSWLAPELSDGAHSLQLKSRVHFGLADTVGAAVSFEVDATPPEPLITSPAYGLAVQGRIPIIGRVGDARFREYRLEVRREGLSGWDTLAVSQSPAVSDTLTFWDTHALSDDAYELRLSVSDSLSLTGVYSVLAIVDNEAPWAFETAPAKVSANAGGEVYSTDARGHFYIPPRALLENTMVNMLRVADADLSSKPEGTGDYLGGYAVTWEGQSLVKAGILDITLGAAQLDAPATAGNMITSKAPAPASPAVYLLPRGGDWRRVGGTITGSRIAVPVRETGIYGVFRDTVTPEGSQELTEFSLAPRVLSKSGEYARGQMAITFTLGLPGVVTVRIHNRAGRLVQEVAKGVSMNAGANLVRWDARDLAGRVIDDGLYLVSVEAFGKLQTKTIAVVR